MYKYPTEDTPAIQVLQMTPDLSESKLDYCARISPVEMREESPQAITDAIIN